MIKVTIYVFLLSLFCVDVIAQIPKNTNVISVKGVGYDQILERLLDSGYVIERRYNDLQTVKTEPKQYPRYWDGKYVINIRVKDSVAFITGTFSAGNLFKDEPVSYVWKNLSRKSMVGVPFYIIDNFAKSFNKPVEYLKQ